MDDIKLAMIGNKDAAKRLTEKGVLIPCPMCKGEGALDSEFPMGAFWVLCTGCGLQTEAFETEAEARLAWNTRAQVPNAEEMERLEGME